MAVVALMRMQERTLEFPLKFIVVSLFRDVMTHHVMSLMRRMRGSGYERSHQAYHFKSCHQNQNTTSAAGEAGEEEEHNHDQEWDLDQTLMHLTDREWDQRRITKEFILFTTNKIHSITTTKRKNERIRKWYNNKQKDILISRQSS